MEDEIYDGGWPGRDWVRVAHGVHVRERCAGDALTRMEAIQRVLPFWSSFTGLTAAAVRGWWLPPVPARLPLFVASGRSDRIDRPGLLVCRHNVLPRWELVGGVRTTGAAETILACARDLSLLDVVVIGEAALHTGEVTRAELIQRSRLRRRGSPLLRRAIPLMDGRAESIFEVLLRVLHVCCGIQVIPQYDVVAPDGMRVARADLALVGTNMLHELDGGHHRTPAQQQHDLRRDRRILAAGYQRPGYTSRDVVMAPIGILRDADATLGRPHDPSLIRTWYSLLQESLFSAAGQRRLERRLGIGPETAEESSA